MRIKLFVALAAVAVALLLPSTARAVCPGGQTTITLSNTNTTGFAVTVVLCLDTSTFVLTVNSITNNAGFDNSLARIDALGYNTTAGLSGTINQTVAWGPKAGSSPFNIDGFGDFTSEVTGPGNQSGIGLAWDFNATPGTSNIVVHVAFGGTNCSTFVSDRTTTSAQPNANCVAIPELGSLTLLGAGLLGLAGLVGRRLLA